MSGFVDERDCDVLVNSENEAVLVIRSEGKSVPASVCVAEGHLFLKLNGQHVNVGNMTERVAGVMILLDKITTMVLDADGEVLACREIPVLIQ